MALLPEWPLLLVAADFTVGPPGVPNTQPEALNAGRTAMTQLTTSRGRQYELGYVEAGTMQMQVEDPAEVLNPANTGSPYNSGAASLLPYRAVQAGAWWNVSTDSSTGNLLNSTNRVPGSVIAYDPSFESGTSGWFGYVGSPGVATSTAQHFDGAQSLAVTFNAANNQAALGMFLPVGVQMTISVYVFVPAGASVTVAWHDFPSGMWRAAATSTGTGVWERLTLTAEAGTPFGLLSVSLASGTAPVTVYLDAMQVEAGDAASAFVTSGPTWFPIYTGYIERYPQAWRDMGLWGIKPLEAVDALSVLSRTVISQSYASTVLNDEPVAFMPLDDPSAPQVVQRPQGGTPFIGYTQLGSQSGQVNFAGDSFLDGTRVVSVVQQNTDPATQFDNTMITYLGTRQGSITMSPQSFTIEAWVRFTSGTPYVGAGVASNTIGQVTGPNFWIGWYTTGGNLIAILIDPNGNELIANNFSVTGGLWYPDGEWHYASIALIGSNNFQFTKDSVSSTRSFVGSASQAVNLSNAFVEATTYFGDPITQVAVANMALYSRPLTESERLEHYRRGIGYLGEFTGPRAGRLLTQYWQSNFQVNGGDSIPMSPDHDYDGRTMLDVLQEISDTDNGLTYVKANGEVTVEGRDTRYRNNAVSWVFGEREDLGELPYTDLAYDYDPTYIYSEVQASIPGGQVYDVINAAAQDAYGQRILSTTLHAATDWYAQQYALAFAQRYGQARLRVSRITFDPSANPRLFTMALQVGISQRVTVKRRTAAGTVIEGDYFVEQVSHNIDAQTFKWLVELQLSPVFVDKAWILGVNVLGTDTTVVY